MRIEGIRNLYNGWRGKYLTQSGYATWNVSLWLNNDHGLYMAMVEFVKRTTDNGKYKGRITATVAEEFVKELLPKGTPDFDAFKTASYKTVHWPSIAGMMREMAGDLVSK